MKCRTYIIALLLISIFVLPGEASAFWWLFKKTKQEPQPAPLASYSVASVSYRHDYGDVVHVMESSNEFVLCETCPKPSSLERSLNPVPIAIRYTGSLSSSPAVVSATPGADPLGSPGNFSQPLERSAATNTSDSGSGTLREVTDQPGPPTGNHLKSSESGTQIAVSAEVDPGLSNESKCHDMTVYFEFGSSQVRADDRTKIIDGFKGINANCRPLVKGFTCDIGNKTSNDRLSIDRAKAVAAVLEGAGIKPFMISGEGKCCYVSEDKSLNRRVEIRCSGEASR